MDSGANIYILSFVKIGSDVRKFIDGIQRQEDDLLNIGLSPQNKESRPIMSDGATIGTDVGHTGPGPEPRNSRFVSCGELWCSRRFEIRQLQCC